MSKKLVVFPAFEYGQTVWHRHGEVPGVVIQIRIGPPETYSYLVSWAERTDTVHEECELVAERTYGLEPKPTESE